MIRTTGALVDRAVQAQSLAEDLRKHLEQIARRTAAGVKPRIYFEEWDGPMICGIGWVSELIAVAGGIDVFAQRAGNKRASDRIVTPEMVIEAAPDLIIGSWCGKKFVARRVSDRAGFDVIPAVREGWLHEIKSPLILQPGPAALTDGLDALVGIIEDWRRGHLDAGSRASASAR